MLTGQEIRAWMLHIKLEQFQKVQKTSQNGFDNISFSRRLFHVFQCFLDFIIQSENGGFLQDCYENLCTEITQPTIVALLAPQI